jgi:hypothetical protein
MVRLDRTIALPPHRVENDPPVKPEECSRRGRRKTVEEPEDDDRRGRWMTIEGAG